MATTGLQDFWKGGLEPITLPEKKFRSVGGKWAYIFNCQKAKELIPAVTRWTKKLIPDYYFPALLSMAATAGWWIRVENEDIDL